MSRYNTPLRYPGGKQKLTPFIAEIIETNGLNGGHYVEPYAGGAGVAIELLVDGKVSQIHLNDSCPAVYAFWRSVITKPEDFCRRITNAALTVDEWRRQQDIFAHPRDFHQLDVGFSLFYLSRCNRSGIPSGGLIGGLHQQGPWTMDVRFPRNELIRRVEVIAALRKSIAVKNMDAEDFLLNYVPELPPQSLIYCDPPYFHKADRLYRNHYAPDDHARIAKVIQKKLKHPWLVSYDSAPEVLAQYGKRRSFIYDLQYNAAKAYKGSEVFFFSDQLQVPSRSAVKCIDSALCNLAI